MTDSCGALRDTLSQFLPLNAEQTTALFQTRHSVISHQARSLQVVVIRSRSITCPSSLDSDSRDAHAAVEITRVQSILTASTSAVLLRKLISLSPK